MNQQVKPEVIDYFCKGCDGLRLHVLGGRRYYCGTCNRNVTVAEVSTNYSASEEDRELLLLSDPFNARLTNAAERGIMEDTDDEED